MGVKIIQIRIYKSLEETREHKSSKNHWWRGGNQINSTSY